MGTAFFELINKEAAFALSAAIPVNQFVSFFGKAVNGFVLRTFGMTHSHGVEDFVLRGAHRHPPGFCCMVIDASAARIREHCQRVLTSIFKTTVFADWLLESGAVLRQPEQ